MFLALLAAAVLLALLVARLPRGGGRAFAAGGAVLALAGAALILRARMAADACPYRAPAAPAAVRTHDELRPAPAAAPRPDCEILSHTAPDGSKLVEFRVCPD